MFKKAIFIGAMLFALFSTPVHAEDNEELIRIDGIVKLYMNTTHSFTVLVRDADTGHLLPEYLSCSTGGYEGTGDVRFIEDLAPGEEMWVEYVAGSKWTGDYCRTMRFHIPSVSAIEGGSARHAGNKSPIVPTKAVVEVHQ